MFVVYQHNSKCILKEEEEGEEEGEKIDTKKKVGVYVYTRSYLYRVNWMVKRRTIE